MQVLPKIMFQIQADASGDAYLHNLLKQSEAQKLIVPAEISGWLQELRQRAAYEVAHQRMPTKQDEEWRFTDISELLGLEVTAGKKVEVAQGSIAPFLIPEAPNSYVVFVNGNYAPELSDTSGLGEGIFVGNLSHLPLEETYNAIEYIARQEGEKEVFTALNSTGFPDVGIIWAQANQVIEKPIHVLFLSSIEEKPIFCQPRCLIIADRGSSLQVIEHYGVITEKCPDWPQQRPYFTNTVTEIFIGENARVNHTRNQRELADAFHIGKTAVSQERSSHYTCNSIHFGAKLSRHNLEIWQKGPQTETYLNGLTMIGQKQIADTHSMIMLNHPHGVTDQLHKCVLDDQAHGIFNGKVFVPKTAQLTSASQLNRNLLLSSKARVDTKPQLQITADNVKCTHGATVSQIDADELFYLQSRGINAESARDLLLDAFAAEVLERIPVPSLRRNLEQCVSCRNNG